MPPDDLSGWGSDRRESDLPVERRLDRLGWRIDSLDRWRKEIDRKINTLEDGIDDLNEANRIAQAVAEELSKRTESGEPAVSIRQRVELTFWQKLGGIVAGMILLADAVRGLVS